MHDRLNELLAASRAETASSESPADEPSDEPADETAAASVHEDPVAEPASPVSWEQDYEDAPNADPVRPQLVAKNVASSSERRMYCFADLPDATDQQATFFDDHYGRRLRKMALTVLEAEGPIREDVLARRVARAHGFARTGAKIKDRILQLIPEVPATVEPVGRFLWPGDGPLASIPFRYTADGDESRRLDEAPMEELIGLVRSKPNAVASDDPALELAREIGLARLAQPAREQLEAAIENATQTE